MTYQLNDELESQARKSPFVQIVRAVVLGLFGAIVLIIAIALLTPSPGANPDARPTETQLTSAVAEPTAPEEDVAFTPYAITPDAAWSAIQSHVDELNRGELIDDAGDADCKVRVGLSVTAKVCTTAGQVDRVMIAKRYGRETDLDAALAAAAAVIAPEANAVDLKRVSRSARSAMGSGNWTTLCPDTHCFRFFPDSGSWMIAANARLP
jgi:hypothetical protein